MKLIYLDPATSFSPTKASNTQRDSKYRITSGIHRTLTSAARTCRCHGSSRRCDSRGSCGSVDDSASRYAPEDRRDLEIKRPGDPDPEIKRSETEIGSMIERSHNKRMLVPRRNPELWDLQALLDR